MPWPFTDVDSPNLDTGPGEDVPLVATAITASQAWLTGGHFTNDGSNQVTFTVTNTAGKILSKFKLSPGGEIEKEWAFRPTLGVKWSANATGLKGHLWGYV